LSSGKKQRERERRREERKEEGERGRDTDDFNDLNYKGLQKYREMENEKLS
jgi:hypothetical protein